MRKLSVLCLLSCVMLFGACSTSDVPDVVENQVPVSLLQIEQPLQRPDVDTGDDTLDFKNATSYLLLLEDRIALYEDRIRCVDSILRKEKCSLSSY